MRTKLSYAGNSIILLLVFMSFIIPDRICDAALNIVDYRSKIHGNFKKTKRKRTKFIIVHTSEGSLSSTLRTVSRGKMYGKRRITYGGHAHYVIARNGMIYRILDKKYRADHAGLSMWNNISNISDCSIGIELVAYHNGTITSEQYVSLKELILIMQKVYSISDRNVLTHCQIAYGRPNKWFKRNHRGRKRCAMNFEPGRAGLTERWSHDPDVKRGRLSEDPVLASVLYRHKHQSFDLKNMVISKKNTAWTIAGGDYGSYSTVYKLPDGRLIRGDQIENTIGWNRIPPGTEVLLNQKAETLIASTGSIHTITENVTAWSVAGNRYNATSTYYVFPGGKYKSGNKINDWDDLPTGTQIIVNYKNPEALSSRQTPYAMVGPDYKTRNIVYLIPGQMFQSGDTVYNFKDLPQGTLLFRPH